MIRQRPMVRTVTPPMIARWLEVKHLTVLQWIRSRDLPALDIGTQGKVHRYVVFRKDLIRFLVQRGMTEDMIRELLGGR